MINLVHIKKDYYVDKKPFSALKDINVSFGDVGFVSILGPSGCGKTTTLNIIGGLDHYTSGDLLVNGKSTKDFKDNDWDAYRNEQVGFVFQNYNLITSQNVLSNVETALLLNGVSAKERKERALKALEVVGLQGSEKKRPNHLSGGQMQRVAIARAIINNPKIILADEPTGALDSNTSVQIMEILKKMSKTCLVIMVTHNSELAHKYSDRIIEMKDGAIIKDSAPLPVDEIKNAPSLEKKEDIHELMDNNQKLGKKYFHEKARSAMTSIASSIGIIGVALVLSITNGFSEYVKNLETSVASSIPITISKVSYSYSSNDLNDGYSEYPSDEKIYVYDTSSTKSIAHTNYFSDEYIQKVLNPMVKDGLAQSVILNRDGLNFNIIKQVTDPDGNITYVQVDQSKSASATGSILDTVISVPTTIFHELYGEEDDLSSMYDTICGRFPKNSDEIVLITDRYNRVKKNTLVSLGLIASTDKTTSSISFSDILGETYKAYKPSKYYQATDDDSFKLNMTAYSNIKPSYDISTGKITYSGTPTTRTIQRYIEPNATQKGLADIYNNDAKYEPKTLKIVGVLRPSETSYMNLMPASIGYVQSLKDEYVEDVENNCQEMQKTSNNAWFFTSVKNSDDEDGLDRLSAAMTSLVESLTSESETVSTSVATAVASSINYEYFFAKQKNIDEGTRVVPYYSGYFNGARRIGQDFREDLVGKFVDTLYSSSGDARTALIKKLIARLSESSFYELNYKSPTYDLSSDEINLDFNILDFVAYFQSYSLISSIMIFPSSITNKDLIKARMDQWNKDTSSDQNVYYTDIMSSYTSTLGTFISLISVVFIIFASISLIVSSIMTANITYVSVIERTKEIGVIRACGARKSDVGHLFETECILIGFVAGTLGILVTLILNIPLSLIIDHLFPGNGLQHIASLNPIHALILIVLSVVLSFVSGFVPARLGAKKDPVVALRGE